jgi:hypothetical protein
MDRLANALKWHAKNPHLIPQEDKTQRAKIAAYRNRYVKARKKADPTFRLACALRGRLMTAMHAFGFIKHKRTLELLGCSVPELRRHLESKWLPGMCWENYGEWHIDHIKPIAAFRLQDRDEQNRCFHWSNLQPLWAMDNFSKSDKWQAEA